MKTSAQRVHNLLLAAAMALPLWAANGAACANDDIDGNRGDSVGAGIGDRRPPMMQGGPEQNGPAAGPRMLRGMPPFGAPGMGGMGGGRVPILRGIELTDAQEDKVFAILHAEQPYLRDQAKAAAKAHEALHAMAGAEKYDDAKAASLAQAAGTAMANIALQHVRTEQKLFAVLTSEQRQQQAKGMGRKDDRDDNDASRRPSH